jgi:adenine-specific DNA-methyltransferase
MKEYVYQPMITYIGNKRKLIDKIEEVVKKT